MSTPYDEWQAFDSATRRVVWKNARHFRAHPDPVVSAVAARYARWYLDARTWHARTQRLAMGLVLADIIVGAVVLAWLSGGPAADRPNGLEKTLIWLVAVVIALSILAPYVVRKVRIIRLYRIELANKLTLENEAVASASVVSAPVANSAGTLPPVAGRAPALGRNVTVRYDLRRVARQSIWVLLIVCFMLVMLVGEGLSSSEMTPMFWVLCAFCAILWLLVFVPYVVLLVRWVLPGRPVVALDAEGVHVPSIECDLQWAFLTEVRLVPRRYSRRGDQQTLVIAFIPRDPSAVLAAVPNGSRRRKRLERSLRVYGTPLSVSDNLMDHSAEQIAAAATTFANVPVRRY